MIVLDASVLIAFLDGADDHHDDAEGLLVAAADEDFGANSLTLAEVLVAPTRAGRIEAVQLALRELEVTELPFPADTAVRLAGLRAETGLKMPDCCVLLAAEDQGARISSFDDQLVQAAEGRSIDILRK